MLLREFVKKVRKDNKLTLKQFSDMLGVSMSAVCQWEKGNIDKVPKSRIYKILALFPNAQEDLLNVPEFFKDDHKKHTKGVLDGNITVGFIQILILREVIPSRVRLSFDEIRKHLHDGKFEWQYTAEGYPYKIIICETGLAVLDVEDISKYVNRKGKEQLQKEYLSKASSRLVEGIAELLVSNPNGDYDEFNEINPSTHRVGGPPNFLDISRTV